MTKEQFEREKHYISTMVIAEGMRKTGILSQDDFKNLDRFFREKYHPIRTFSLDFPAKDLVESGMGRDDHEDYSEN